MGYNRNAMGVYGEIKVKIFMNFECHHIRYNTTQVVH